MLLEKAKLMIKGNKNFGDKGVVMYTPAMVLRTTAELRPSTLTIKYFQNGTLAAPHTILNKSNGNGKIR